MKKILVIILIAISQFAFAQTNKIEKAPELDFSYWFANESNESISADQHIILEFWASWCPYCFKVIPHINQLSDKYGSQIAFISVNSFDPKQKIEEIMKREIFSTYVVMEENKKLVNAFNIGTFPSAVLIDNKGNLRWRGNPDFLTEELIDTFLETDEIIPLPNQEYTIEKQNIQLKDANSTVVEYVLSLKPSNMTTAKSVSHTFEDRFYMSFQNMPYQNFIEMIYYEMGDLDEFVWEENRSSGIYFDFFVSSESKGTKNLIFKDVISRFSKNFNFKIEKINKEEGMVNQVSYY